MNISVKGEYALHAIFDLALQKFGEPIKIADIAKRQRIPQKFLELILAGLKQGGFVESRRGAEGGYLLARAPQAITVGQVVRYVEGAKRTKPARKPNAADPFAAEITESATLVAASPRAAGLAFDSGSAMPGSVAFAASQRSARSPSS